MQRRTLPRRSDNGWIAAEKNLEAVQHQAPKALPKDQSQYHVNPANIIVGEIMPQRITTEPRDMIYQETLQSFRQTDPQDYPMWSLEMRNKHSKEFRDGFHQYVQDKALAGRGPNSRNLSMLKFREMLQDADCLKENTASSIVNTWLYIGGYDPQPQFDLRLQIAGDFALRLTGGALHPPEVDIDTCESYGIKTVLPELYTGVRYKTGSSDSPLCTRYFVTLGELRNLEYTQNMD
jgi:hypothetical protein